MGSQSDLHCWEIMKCDKSENCPAKKNPKKPCWEIFREKDDDYRNFFHVCRDCIVHVLKADKSVLSIQEIKNIVDAKTNRRTSRKPIRLPTSNRNVVPLPSR